MNAVLSANTLPWRQSAAFDSSLSVGDVNPIDVYEFIGHTTFDAAFRESVLSDTRDVLARFRLPTTGQILAPGLLEGRLAMTADERAALEALSLRVRDTTDLGDRAIERGVLREGHGMPAIALLVLGVAVAVVVFIFLYAHLPL